MAISLTARKALMQLATRQTPAVLRSARYGRTDRLIRWQPTAAWYSSSKGGDDHGKNTGKETPPTKPPSAPKKQQRHQNLGAKRSAKREKASIDLQSILKQASQDDRKKARKHVKADDKGQTAKHEAKAADKNSAASPDEGKTQDESAAKAKKSSMSFADALKQLDTKMSQQRKDDKAKSTPAAAAAAAAGKEDVDKEAEGGGPAEDYVEEEELEEIPLFSEEEVSSVINALFNDLETKYKQADVAAPSPEEEAKDATETTVDKPEPIIEFGKVLDGPRLDYVDKPLSQAQQQASANATMLAEHLEAASLQHPLNDPYRFHRDPATVGLLDNDSAVYAKGQDSPYMPIPARIWSHSDFSDILMQLETAEPYVRYFAQLLATGLSQNPDMSVKQKRIFMGILTQAMHFADVFKKGQDLDAHFKHEFLAIAKSELQAREAEENEAQEQQQQQQPQQ